MNSASGYKAIEHLIKRRVDVYLGTRLSLQQRNFIVKSAINLNKLLLRIRATQPSTEEINRNLTKAAERLNKELPTAAEAMRNLRENMKRIKVHD